MKRWTTLELLEKIRLGEDSFLELKEVRFSGAKIKGPAQDNLADELAAFANAAGGELVLGVADSPRAVVGLPIERLEDVERLVREACEHSVRPPLSPIIERVSLPGIDGTPQAVLRVTIARSLFVHQSSGGYYHRVGSAKRPIPPEQLGRLFQQRSQSRLIRFDETPVIPATLAHLDENLWRRFAPERTTDSPEVLLDKLAMANQCEGSWHPTVAGLLMGSTLADTFLPGAFIQAVAYQGDSVIPEGEAIYQLDAKDIRGPLDQQIHQACAFVRKNMRTMARKRLSGGREDIPQFSMRAVFEAVTNAVAHRDYSMAGSKVRLRLFNNRLEIYSPGMLPNTMTTESIAHRQSARNEAITSLLARCPLREEAGTAHRDHIMDKRGEGVPIILTESQNLSGRRPEYRLLDESELLLTIYGVQAHRPE
jgi:ATP-dependent DNA helicase RecG